jgi:hypothetical protein
MVDPIDHPIVLVDSATATSLAQILPVLLLTLTVELRRTRLHRELRRLSLGVFFFAFGIVETILVLSIDGALYPFQWFDLASALIIFSLLAIIFSISLVDPPPTEQSQRATDREDVP